MSNIDNSSFSAYYTFHHSETMSLAPMTIVMAGDEQCSPNYLLNRVNAEIGVLIYLLSGEGELVLEDGRSFYLQARDVIALPPGISYRYGVNKDNPWRILWFNIAGELYPHLLKRYGLSEQPVHTSVSAAVADCFLEGISICRGQGAGDPVQDRLCVAVYQTLLALWRQASRQSGHRSVAQKLRERIDEYAASQPDGGFDINHAATELGVSVRQLERDFKEAYSETPYRCYQRQRLMLAKQYLNNTALSVKEISNLLGFCDPYYFSNCFKKEEGISPGRYRRK